MRMPDVKMHSDCFYWTEALRVVDLPALTTLTVGNYCFAKVKTADHKRWGLLGDVREQICRSWSVCALVRERARDSRTCSTRGTTRRNCGVDEER